MSELGSERIIERATLLMLTSGIIALSARMLVAPLNSAVFGVVICTLLALATSYFAIRVLRAYVFGAYLMIAIATISLSVLATITGGLNSPIVILFPIVPIAASLLFRGPLNWILCAYFVLLTIGYVSMDVTSYTEEQRNFTTHQNNFVEAVWVIIGVFIVTAFAAFFSIENRKLNEVLQKEAQMDYLTLLPNRRGVENRLTNEVSIARNGGDWLSVIMIDIDHFKKYNDINGHAMGDDCIRSVAKMLKKSFNGHGEFVGRYGGEEFIATIRSSIPEIALRKAERVRRAIEEMSIRYGPENPDPVTITLGCHSALASDISNIDKLISQADGALYLGKARGRNQVAVPA